MFVGLKAKGSNNAHFEVRNWSQTFDTVVWIGFQHDGWNSSQLVWTRLQQRSWNSQIRSSARKTTNCAWWFGEIGGSWGHKRHIRAYTGKDWSSHVMHPRAWFTQLRCILWCIIWYLRTWRIACVGNIYIHVIYRWKPFETAYVQIYVCRWWQKWCHKVHHPPRIGDDGTLRCHVLQAHVLQHQLPCRKRGTTSQGAKPWRLSLLFRVATSALLMDLIWVCVCFLWAIWSGTSWILLTVGKIPMHFNWCFA